MEIIMIILLILNIVFGLINQKNIFGNFNFFSAGFIAAALLKVLFYKI